MRHGGNDQVLQVQKPPKVLRGRKKPVIDSLTVVLKHRVSVDNNHFRTWRDMTNAGVSQPPVKFDGVDPGDTENGIYAVVL